MEKKKMKLKNYGPVYVDMTNEGGFLRSECADRFRAALEKSERREQEKEKCWALAEELHENTSMTIILAGLFGLVFIFMVYLDSLYDAGHITLHISDTIIIICGVIAGILAVASVAQMVIALILERR